MKVLPTAIPEVVLIEPPVFRDERGFFCEVWQAERFAALGLPSGFVQDNHSSSKRGTLRGLHIQLGQLQGKLVRCTRGEIFDVAVDLRGGSPTFGRWVGATLSAESFHELWIPEGFAHGFAVTSEVAEVQYKVTALWDPTSEVSVRWNDPEIAIAWPLAEPLLSAKDRDAPRLAELLDRLPPYRVP